MSETPRLCECGHEHEMVSVPGPYGPRVVIQPFSGCTSFRPASPPPREPETETPSEEQIAQRFHEAYERLAPSFGYETRPESAKPWSDVPEQNRRLMIAVAGEVRASLAAALVQERDGLREDAALGKALRSALATLAPWGMLNIDARDNGVHRHLGEGQWDQNDATRALSAALASRSPHPSEEAP